MTIIIPEGFPAEWRETKDHNKLLTLITGATGRELKTLSDLIECLPWLPRNLMDMKVMRGGGEEYFHNQIRETIRREYGLRVELVPMWRMHRYFHSAKESTYYLFPGSATDECVTEYMDRLVAQNQISPAQRRKQQAKEAKAAAQKAEVA